LLGVLRSRAPLPPGAATQAARRADVPASALPRGQRIDGACSAAVGPDWLRHLAQAAPGGEATAAAAGVRIELGCELAALEPLAGDWPLRATLTSGVTALVDVVVAAAGVEPCVEWCVRKPARRRCSWRG
jgi:hypothetical protein